MSYVRVKTEMYIGFYCGNLKERDHMENIGLDGRVILK
jgi:hypothetical protein